MKFPKTVAERAQLAASCAVATFLPFSAIAVVLYYPATYPEGFSLSWKHLVLVASIGVLTGTLRGYVHWRLKPRFDGESGVVWSYLGWSIVTALATIPIAALDASAGLNTVHGVLMWLAGSAAIGASIAFLVRYLKRQ